MAATFDRVTRTADEVRGWQLALADIDFEAASHALIAHFRDPVHGTEFLKPAHITRQIAAGNPSVVHPPRAHEITNECEVHPGYPLPCAACQRHPEELARFTETGERPELIHFAELATIRVGRTPDEAA